MKPSPKFVGLFHRVVLAGAFLGGPALLLGGCQTVKPASPAPGPCTPADPKAVPGQSVPDRFSPVTLAESAETPIKYRPCEVPAGSTFQMAAEYDWVPNTNRGSVKLWLDATATTPEGKQLYGAEILTSPLGPFEFNLNWSKGDPIGRPIVRLVSLTLRDDVQPGTQLRLRLRNPESSGDWPGPTSGIGPVAILDVVKAVKSDAPGEAAPVGLAPEATAFAQMSTEPVTTNGAVPEKNRSGRGGQSVPGEYTAWAMLAPYTHLGEAGKAQSFK